MVAGLASSFRSKGSALGQETITGKNFYTDAARVYISQRTDLDTYFGVTEGMKYKTDSKNGCSGVGIKADSVLVSENGLSENYPEIQRVKDSLLSIPDGFDVSIGLSPNNENMKIIQNFNQLEKNNSVI